MEVKMKKQQVISFRKDEKISKEVQDKIFELLGKEGAEEIEINFAENPNDEYDPVAQMD